MSIQIHSHRDEGLYGDIGSLMVTLLWSLWSFIIRSQLFSYRPRNFIQSIGLDVDLGTRFDHRGILPLDLISSGRNLFQTISLHSLGDSFALTLCEFGQESNFNCCCFRRQSISYSDRFHYHLFDFPLFPTLQVYFTVLDCRIGFDSVADIVVAIVLSSRDAIRCSSFAHPF
jgi:hypothetical protein